MICLWLHFSALVHLGGSARVDKLEEVLLRTLGRNQPEPWANINLEAALKDQGELFVLMQLCVNICVAGQL